MRMTAKEFFLSLPEKVPAEMIKEVDTLFHFDIPGEGGGQFAIKVQEGQMEVKEDFTETAKCEIKAEAKHFMAVLNGELNPMMAVLMGKVKISDKEELFKYAKIFGFM